MRLTYLCGFSRQRDIANYWPGMHNTAFLVIIVDNDGVDGDYFDNVVICFKYRCFAEYYQC